MDLEKETDGSFLDDVKAFDSQVKAQMDSAKTVGDREAQRQLFENRLAPKLAKFADRLSDIALYSESDQASLGAIKTALAYLIDGQAGKDDPFDAFMKGMKDADSKVEVKNDSTEK